MGVLAERQRNSIEYDCHGEDAGQQPADRNGFVVGHVMNSFEKKEGLGRGSRALPRLASDAGASANSRHHQ
jgi:hypothetical protein